MGGSIGSIEDGHEAGARGRLFGDRADALAEAFA